MGFGRGRGKGRAPRAGGAALRAGPGPEAAEEAWALDCTAGSTLGVPSSLVPRALLPGPAERGVGSADLTRQGGAQHALQA